MRRAMVAGNWKMNGSIDSIHRLVDGILSGLDGVSNTDVVVCPPAVYLTTVKNLLGTHPVGLGAQNLCDQPGPGAFTGENSAAMLKDVGCQYVIVGHSERRALYGESDAVVADKFSIALAGGLIPIVCVGELLEEREAGETEKVIGRQLDAILDSQAGVAALNQAVIAYEPVWAIGTGKTATPDQAQQVHAFIRARVAERDTAVADGLRILYGGSVKADNAAELFGMDDIDGGLIGGASLQPDDFLAICRAAV